MMEGRKITRLLQTLVRNVCGWSDGLEVDCLEGIRKWNP
jgi:hypothetical protein